MGERERKRDFWWGVRPGGSSDADLMGCSGRVPIMSLADDGGDGGDGGGLGRHGFVWGALLSKEVGRRAEGVWEAVDE